MKQKIRMQVGLAFQGLERIHAIANIQVSWKLRAWLLGLSAWDWVALGMWPNPVWLSSVWVITDSHSTNGSC